ncbi:hypothetical protein LCGC14_2439710 [marine sediment metagenome]|uniref:Uncharacterized protein n=1 Tax=marine sediment metagenome TaxID=412755 RepID=A0A0F9DWD0_9ZZZZ
MYLEELIERLEQEDPDLILPLGFSYPHSYRGFYEQLAFQPVKYIFVCTMLESARNAIGQVFTGYKGGEYKMNEYSDVWLSEYGSTGETIGPILLDLLIKQGTDAMLAALMEQEDA